MAPRETKLRLDDILEAIDGIEAALKNLSYEQFREQWVLRHAAERGVEIISEASRHISDELKAGQPEIPWAEIAGVGNILRHAYSRVNPEIIWNIVQKDFAPLKRAVTQMIEDLNRSG
jgi:uncharacterized protein with HEPN domain